MSPDSGLPYWVPIGRDSRAGVVHQAADGLWRANNWQGCLGSFAIEGEALAAIYAAPPRPKRTREPEEPPPDGMRWQSLTDSASCHLVMEKQRRVGAVIRTAEGRFAAWTKDGKLGEYRTQSLADAAARAAQAKKVRA